MTQANNFRAAFPGHQRSSFYGRPLSYIPGIDHISANSRARMVTAPGNVIGAPLAVEANGPMESKFAVLDPNRNIPDQYSTAILAGFNFVELGHPDAMTLGEFMLWLTHTHGVGLGVVAKNALWTPGPMQYLTHPNVVGCVVERGKGTPLEYDKLRREIHKDGLLPVWFVFDGAAGADQCAEEIRAHKLKGMGVTFSAGLSGEKYSDTHPVLNPTT